MYRRSFLKVMGIVPLMGIFFSCRSLPAQGGPVVASLRQQIEYDLRVGQPTDIEFLDRVFYYVDQGKIPVSMVQTSFYWARRKPSYKIKYFRHAMIVRARQVGVEL